ncbi:hypothetical protein [Mastigocoleus sp. MO_188.B34]|uniref:hypothetical protein n=1 Tax=Mastigocoleus sp. MO_188.B34 TaxID=3036635 RepID=UPI00262DFE59|nr:hypothetical protein [Mastigocoleus sp. MO_188.B34]MDJ0696478.1 hypothetical protein [Mastigocoleus sp. MO_188.B34]
MGIFSNQKLCLGVAFAALFGVTLTGSYLHTRSQSISYAQSQLQTNNQNQTKNQNSVTQRKSSLQLAANYQNSLTANPVSTINSNQQEQYTAQKKSFSKTYQVIDELKRNKFKINGDRVFRTGKLPRTKVDLNQSDLLTVLVNTRKYFQEHSDADPDVQRTGILGTQGVTLPDVLKTLDFMIATLRQDIANGRPTRLQDPNFINKHFRVIKWSAYNPKNLRRKNLRITKYAVFSHSGSRKKTSTYDTPIYSLKDELATDKFYKKYTKQDVLSGIYERGGKEFGKVEPLAYLTREGLEEALMQGTILINFPDGSQAFFNVDRNNGIPYVKGLKRRAQKRYWYFRQVDAIKGYGHEIDAKISVKPGVTFAGDVLNVGLGKIVVLEYTKGGRRRLKMGVLADTGGAFLPNLYQLDFLAGIFPNRQKFNENNRRLPAYAKAYILVKK